MTDDLIAADKRLDVISGSAGAILCLLRLYRDTQLEDVLARAVRCGEHLMRQARIGPQGTSNLGWAEPRAASPQRDVARRSRLCLCACIFRRLRPDAKSSSKPHPNVVGFENSSYDADPHNWPDWRRRRAGLGMSVVSRRTRYRTSPGRPAETGRHGRNAPASRCPQRARGRRTGLARRGRHTLLWHARQRGIFLRGRRGARPYVRLRRGG